VVEVPLQVRQAILAALQKFEGHQGPGGAPPAPGVLLPLLPRSPAAVAVSPAAPCRGRRGCPAPPSATPPAVPPPVAAGSSCPPPWCCRFSAGEKCVWARRRRRAAPSLWPLARRPGLVERVWRGATPQCPPAPVVLLLACCFRSPFVRVSLLGDRGGSGGPDPRAGASLAPPPAAFFAAAMKTRSFSCGPPSPGGSFWCAPRVSSPPRGESERRSRAARRPVRPARWDGPWRRRRRLLRPDSRASWARGRVLRG
jgi:hypothetical protein